MKNSFYWLKAAQQKLISYALVPIAFASSMAFSVNAMAICDDSDSFVDRACSRVSNTWKQGNSDLYIPFHAHHFRYAYTDEEIDRFREDNWGLGYGRSLYDADGNWDGVYFMGFLDSNSKPEYTLGYSHQWMWGAPQGLHAGLGYTAFLNFRSNFFHYFPTPLLLPVASVNYSKVSVNTTFVPGTKGNGNILFFWSRVGF